MNNKFYITTAIDYVNAPPHLGHAMEKIQADAIARYQRLLGKDVYFLSGADEHGIKIARAAKEQNKDIKKFTEENTEKFKKLLKDLDISIDDFIRTSDQKRHWPGARKLWGKLVEAGGIYKSKYKGYYCVGCEGYVTEKDLIDAKCPYHLKEPEIIDEENYFFRLSKYAKEIESRIKNQELRIIPETRKNEVLEMIEAGIEDISFSRPTEKLEGWGIPVPGDEKQLMYVWCDALVNYISSLGYGIDEKKMDFWPADLHVIGKDILRFHTIIWPAMLLSAKLALPKTILAHGFVLSEGKRMSKTLGNVIDPFDLITEYGTDAVRYYFLREMTPFEDGDITLEKFKEAYNANLANGLGNLTSRVMKMSEQYLKNEDYKKLAPYKNEVFYSGFMENFELNKAMDLIWQKISEMDLKIQKTQPFKLIKTDEKKAKEILRELVSGLQQIATMLKPFLPSTSEKILKAIEVNKMPEPLFLRVA
ncbi:MAG: methionine--tRNA ligase [Candidatus Terrybacteria bacterium]|nr:methionine--tRNA ligase [Candidatus Terrybacteria bacterium]